MLKNMWYAIEFAHVIGRQPKRLTVLGQELVAYRDTKGNPVVMSDLCVHRGGALSDGELDGDCIRCPYHGWKYEPEGACVEIPANQAGRPIPKKARVDAYPARDRYGFLWAFLGDLPEAERPPFPELPYFVGDTIPGHRAITGEFTWNAHYARVMENAFDFAHAPWVHGSSFGNREKPQVPEFDVELGDWYGTASVDLEPSPAKGLWRLLYKGDKKEILTSNGFWMPNITLLHVRLPLGNMILWDANVPVDDFTTITKWIQYRDFFPKAWADKNSEQRVYKIFNQDKGTVEAQRPELLPYDLGAELHVRADALQVAYRQTRNRLLDSGWGIDMHKIQSEYTRHQATVIPSPARRENPELAQAWVMKEVPVRGEVVPEGHKLRRPGDSGRTRTRPNGSDE